MLVTLAKVTLAKVADTGTFTPYCANSSTRNLCEFVKMPLVPLP